MLLVGHADCTASTRQHELQIIQIIQIIQIRGLSCLKDLDHLNGVLVNLPNVWNILGSRSPRWMGNAKVPVAVTISDFMQAIRDVSAGFERRVGALTTRGQLCALKYPYT